MRARLLAGFAVGLNSSLAWGNPPPPVEHRALTPSEVEAWLDAPEAASSAAAEAGARDEIEEEVPPRPPRKHGFTVETGIGALGHLGALKRISPVSPWFHLKFGYEPFSFLLAFLESDLIFSSTEYANPPPAPRTYRMYGGGAGVRATLPLGEHAGIYLEGSAGLSRVSEDVLEVYGYRRAADFHLYFGGRVGAEWYPANPNFAVTAHGGVRSYQSGLERDRSSEPALCWLSGLGLRYTF